VYLISNALLNAGYPRASEEVMVIRDRWATRVRLEAAEEQARERICRSSRSTGNSLDPCRLTTRETGETCRLSGEGRIPGILSDVFRLGEGDGRRD
jgi:hypothetical protein